MFLHFGNTFNGMTGFNGGAFMMKNTPIICAVSVLLLAVAGCGTHAISPAPPKSSTSTLQQKPAQHSSKKSNSYLKSGASTSKSASLQAVAFAGINVTRSTKPALAKSALPEGYQTSDHGKYTSNKYQIVDSWTGLLYGKKFIFDVYQNNLNHHILIGAAYNSQPVLAGSIPSTSIKLSNFTGDQIIFSYQNASGTHWMGFHLTNGQLLTEQNALKQSGCFPCHGGRPGWIMGLAQKFTVTS